MKVLFDHSLPFALAHGGFQIQIEQTKAALEKRGIEIEYVRWWDPTQTGQIIHYFGRPSGTYIEFAQAKGFKVVIAELHTGLGSRSFGARALQKVLMTISGQCLPSAFTARLAWDAYQKADAFIALTPWEAHLMQTIFKANPDRIHVIANGVEEIFFTPAGPSSQEKSKYLLCTASIHSRKRVLELAEAAGQARVPLWVIGRPYADSDSYYQRFLQVQKQYAEWVQYEGAVSDRATLARIYQQARGFVLLSTMESLSLSALEAAAASCPLLLADLPWARSVFGDTATYCSVKLEGKALMHELSRFSAKAPSLSTAFKPSTWDEVAGQVETCYRSL
jgi:glycosyltransferase involved in cell wall biosynthesis